MKIMALLILAFFLTVSAQAAQYTVHNLGVLPGHVGSWSVAINNSGQIVCGSAVDSSDYSGGFIWSKGLPPLDLAGQGSFGFAKGINDLGDVVGSTYGSNWDDYYPTIRTSAGQLVPLAKPETPAYSYAVATAINNNRQCVGYTGVLATQGTCAALWNTDGSITRLSGDSPGNCTATAINDQGQAVWNSESTAYRWIPGIGSIELQGLYDGDSTQALGMSEDGFVAGTSGGHAVLWSPTGVILDLGIGVARDVNSRRQVVGFIGTRAVLWQSDGQGVYLGPLSDTLASYATAINDSGWIIGDSMGALYDRAVLWEPVPEPSSLLVLACGMAGVSALILKRRRARR